MEIDYEFILIFKKPGPSKKVAPEIKAASKLTKAEWKEYFAGHWHFGGVRQAGHEAMFPDRPPALDQNVQLRGRHGAGPVFRERHHGQGGPGFGTQRGRL